MSHNEIHFWIIIALRLQDEFQWKTEVNFLFFKRFVNTENKGKSIKKIIGCKTGEKTSNTLSNGKESPNTEQYARVSNLSRELQEIHFPTNNEVFHHNTINMQMISLIHDKLYFVHWFEFVMTWSTAVSPSSGT